MATKTEEIEVQNETETEEITSIDWDSIKAEKSSKYPQLVSLVGKRIRIHEMGTEAKARGDMTYKLARLSVEPDFDAATAEWYEIPGGLWTKLNNTFARYHGKAVVNATVEKGEKRVYLT